MYMCDIYVCLGGRGSFVWIKHNHSSQYQSSWVYLACQSNTKSAENYQLPLCGGDQHLSRQQIYHYNATPALYVLPDNELYHCKECGVSYQIT